MFRAIIFTLVVGFCVPAFAEERIKYQVDHVIDGDTFETTDGTRVRIWGIDTPERNENDYWSAGFLLDARIDDQEVLCKLKDTDRYQRSVMMCTQDGLDLGSYMVSIGAARDYKKYSKGYYAKEETSAREKAIGLWKKADSGI